MKFRYVKRYSVWKLPVYTFFRDFKSAVIGIPLIILTFLILINVNVVYAMIACLVEWLVLNILFRVRSVKYGKKVKVVLEG